MSIGRSSTASEMESEKIREVCRIREAQALRRTVAVSLGDVRCCRTGIRCRANDRTRGYRRDASRRFCRAAGPPGDAEGRKGVAHAEGQVLLTGRASRTVGSTIDFPNADSIFHNVFSLTPPAPFDLGLYRAGASRTRVFSAPATYRVFCNIHPQMTAVVVVVPTSFVTVTGKDGSFSLELPPGTYRLTAISGRAAPTVREISVPASGLRVDGLALDERPFRDEPHKNKFGKEYPREAYRQ